MRTKIIHKNHTAFGNFYQLKLPLNTEYIIPENDSVRLLGQIIEEMNLREIYQSYSRSRNNQASPKQLLKILFYGYKNRYYSSRKIETARKRDINVMDLLEGAPVPDHATIARFRSFHFAPFSKNIMAQMTLLLAGNEEVSLKNIFIDGTKIESVANKYSFVWEKAVIQNQQKLLAKIPQLFQESEIDFGIKVVYEGVSNTL